ncbi:MAG: MerR family transcriptional regulator [Burkholderiaceae bacterium]|nr:MerR family transcriptional regulator [Burkholderiaceae bacterium]
MTTKMHSIADVERDTGLGKDTLRMWERRYGFPEPQRDAHGERLYTPAQIEKLRAIKRLMDAGHRPGRLVPRSLRELQRLSDTVSGSVATEGARSDEIDALLDLVRKHDVDALLHALAVAESRCGLRDFAVQVVAPLAERVGEAWMHGDLRVFEEHTFTECVKTTLYAALRSLPDARGRPRTLLATLPGEPHGLGLLMARTLLELDDCACLSLGVQVPIADIASAVSAWRADIVGLSVTGCMKTNLVRSSLVQLRAALPAHVMVWVGGAAPALHRRPIDGIVRVPRLESIAQSLQAWREERGRRTAVTTSAGGTAPPAR